MTTTVLMSIRPRHVADMAALTKLWEFRRLTNGAPWLGRRVVIYSTAPVKRVVGEFTVDALEMGPPVAVWSQTCETAGITRAEFDRYFRDAEVAVALGVGDLRMYAEPIDPRARAAAAGERFVAPQSWRYWPPPWWEVAT